MDVISGLKSSPLAQKKANRGGLHTRISTLTRIYRVSCQITSVKLHSNSLTPFERHSLQAFKRVFRKNNIFFRVEVEVKIIFFEFFNSADALKFFKKKIF